MHLNMMHLKTDFLFVSILTVAVGTTLSVSFSNLGINCQ